MSYLLPFFQALTPPALAETEDYVLCFFYVPQCEGDSAFVQPGSSWDSDQGSDFIVCVFFKRIKLIRLRLYTCRSAAGWKKKNNNFCLSVYQIKYFFCNFRLRLHCKRNKLVRELEETVRLASSLHTQLKRFLHLSSAVYDNLSIIFVVSFSNNILKLMIHVCIWDLGTWWQQ